MRRAPRLLWITGLESLATRPADRAATLVQAGVDAVQLRAPELSDRELVELGRELRAALAGSGAALLVNDRFDLALACGADGVHLKSDGLAASELRRLLRERDAELAEGFLVGRACHSGRELAVLAEEGAADYATLSPLHETGGKAGLGWEAFAAELQQARDEAQAPLPAWLALGGVGEQDLAPLAALARPGERWGIAGIGLFQAPASEAEAAKLAQRLGAALPLLP